MGKIKVCQQAYNMAPAKMAVTRNLTVPTEKSSKKCSLVDMGMCGRIIQKMY
jgi:hypothetical protein